MRPSRTLSRRGDGTGDRARAAYTLDARFEILLDLEVPDPDDGPTGLHELGVNTPVASTIASDLRIPERTRLAPVVVRVSVPERAVDEDRDAPTNPGQIG